ncbi:MAG: branched-chain amino acid ABC transporter permease [Acetobacteraceae bacterium]|nr:branched-chain amino acid ABC transporter permease [Acetobacteraceae bacterium]
MLAEALARHRWWIALTLLGIAAAAVVPFVLMPFHVRVGQMILLSTGLGLAWTLLGGFAGYWSFGHTAFIGLGAFAAGLFEVNALGTEFMRTDPLLGFALGLLAGMAACAVAAALVAWPILRLRGIYFAVAMLGVAQVLSELTNSIEAFQGSLGLVLPRIPAFGLRTEAVFYYLLLIAAVIILAIAFLVKNARIGQGLAAMREDEDTARMLGVPTERYKITMFVLSAALTGALGVIYAHSLGYITTGSVYRTDFSLNMIVYNLLGGIGTLVGPLIGAAIMVLLTQVVLGSFLNLHMFLTGAMLVALVVAAPKGIMGGLAGTWQSWRRRRTAAP